ncbi:hypothetical protein PV10_08020 [Exophiala mesophila]|uniref:Pyridoxamine 5'-phosphate oxidase N-terminal domain-containing protein n=1 Tax=Exophiala mesophila TaxID=212818 RepID=A0A0D1Z0H7_EXOME|nr:uncharacterized protein PV10_08020 [Exophiala mesophila]KIV88327.1 hypothetical protein PV10_08020 [Exophiala mesophila]
MAESHNPPLNYEASATSTHRTTSTTLPSEVSQCLKNARFLHLATISSASNPEQVTPHVSLMNYTFLPTGTNTTPGPLIIMTTNSQSIKTQNLLANPRVSLLVHDWVSHRPPTTSSISGQRSGSPPAAATRSSLASLLLNLNTSALSSISTTIAGTARFLEAGTEEEKWCKETHLANNTFGDQVREEAGLFGVGPQNTDGGNSSSYIAGEDVRVVVVPVREGRTADWKGGVKDWVVLDERGDSIDDQDNSRGRRPDDQQQPLVNGIVN